LASDPDHILWTDDLVQAQVAAQEFGARRVWTQLLLGTFADAGLITLEEYSDASARLVGMEFIATSFDASSLLAGFRLTDWSPYHHPAAQFIKIFSDREANPQALFAIFVAFVQKLYREPIPPSDRCAVTRSLLNAMERSPDRVALLMSLRKYSARVFGINALGQTQFENCYDQ